MRETIRYFDCNIIYWSPSYYNNIPFSIFYSRHYFVPLWKKHVWIMFLAISTILKININFYIAIIIFEMLYGNDNCNYKFLNIDINRTYSRALKIFIYILKIIDS